MKNKKKRSLKKRDFKDNFKTYTRYLWAVLGLAFKFLKKKIRLPCFRPIKKILSDTPFRQYSQGFNLNT